jgi:hypothetical protein
MCGAFEGTGWGSLGLLKEVPCEGQLTGEQCEQMKRELGD